MKRKMVVDRLQRGLETLPKLCLTKPVTIQAQSGTGEATAHGPVAIGFALQAAVQLNHHQAECQALGMILRKASYFFG
ncbi:MAG: hypothetical protein PVF70_01960 [Anaerolineales bacterium]|jgi:hypothetical protein